MQIDPSYKYLFEIISEILGLDVVAVEELLLDCPSVSLARYSFSNGSLET